MNGGPRPPGMTYAQVAAMLGRSVSTIEKWVRDGHIPYYRVGRLIRFDPAEIRRWLEEEGDRYAPVRPLKKPPGAQYVHPADTLGDLEHCWCGDLVDHDWPGKDHGAPHPHEHERNLQVVVVNEERPDPTPEWRRIERGALRGFHATLKNFLTQCVNRDLLPWRAINNGILLFPPDGSNAISVYCRNNDTQMRALNTWYQAHVEPSLTPQPADLERLAEQVNDPAEHPAREFSSTEAWRPYLHSKGEPSDIWETDGTTIRCRLCVGTDTAYETPFNE